MPDNPPTIEEHARLTRRRNLTDDPIGAHRRGGVRRTTGATRSPDILRRSRQPVDGERDHDQAAFARVVKTAARELGTSCREACDFLCVALGLPE